VPHSCPWLGLDHALLGESGSRGLPCSNWHPTRRDSPHHGRESQAPPNFFFPPFQPFARYSRVPTHDSVAHARYRQAVRDWVASSSDPSPLRREILGHFARVQPVSFAAEIAADVPSARPGSDGLPFEGMGSSLLLWRERCKSFGNSGPRRLGSPARYGDPQEARFPKNGHTTKRKGVNIGRSSDW
jgi:hypothetical protein